MIRRHNFLCSSTLCRDFFHHNAQISFAPTGKLNGVQKGTPVTVAMTYNKYFTAQLPSDGFTGIDLMEISRTFDTSGANLLFDKITGCFPGAPNDHSCPGV